MQQKQVILFDLDGTLTDPALGITNGVQRGLARFGIQEPDRTSLYRFIGPPLLESFQVFYGLTEADAVLAVAAYREYYGQTGLFENKVYPGIPQLLQTLRDAGKTLAVATSKPEAFSVRILERFDLARYFHHIGGASFDQSRSAKADVVRYTLGLCGKPDPSSVVMVGDRKHDVLGAAANGIETIGVLYGYGDRSELESAGAKAIAESVEHLGHILLE